MLMLKRWTVLATLIVFFTGSLSVGQTSTSYQFAPGADPASSTIPTMSPFPTNLAGATSMVKGGIASCQVGSLLQNKSLIGLVGNAVTGTKPNVAGVLGITKMTDSATCENPKTQFTCDMNCATPSVAKAPSCTSEYFRTSKLTGGKMGVSQPYKMTDWSSDEEQKKFSSEEDKIAAFTAYLDKKKTCPSDAEKALDAAYAAYDCMVAALSDATNAAAQALQTGIQQNQAQYGKMTTFVQQASDQMKQVDDILGPEDEGNGISKLGGDQFSGLLGMQKSLNAQMAQMIQQDGTFKTKVAKIQKDTLANEQTLEADRMGVVSSCMKGEKNIGVGGGTSLLCYKPRQSKDAQGNVTQATDQSGNPVYSKQACGPMEFIQSQVEQAAYLNKDKNGRVLGVIRSQKARDKASDNVTELNAFMTSMMRDLGDYDQTNPKDPNDPNSGGKLAPRVTSWADLATKYSAEMAQIQADTGVNLQQEMSVIAGHCFADSYTWKSQQQRSASSAYNVNKQNITNDTNALTSDLNSGLAQLNSGYSAAMAVLGGQAVTLNRFQCTTTDPAKMEACYGSIRQNLQDLLEGNGSITTTSKNITGGSMIGGFTVTCKGINGCVTALQQVKTAKKQQVTAAQKAMVDFVQSSNSQIQAQLNNYGQSVAAVQSQVLAQYASIKQLMAQTIGAAGKDAPPFMDKDMLKQSDGPPPGPYQMPSDMSKVIAGAIPAPGLINFADTGLSALKEAANEKLEKKAELLSDLDKKFGDLLDSFEGKYAECTKDNNPAPADSTTVGSDGFDPTACNNVMNACYGSGSESDSGTLPGSSAWVETIANLLANSSLGGQESTKAAQAQLIHEVSNAPAGACKENLTKCQVASSAKMQKYNDEVSAAASSKTAQH